MEESSTLATPTALLGNVILTSSLVGSNSQDGQVLLYADSGSINTSISEGKLQSTLSQTNILSIGENYQLPNNNCIIVVKTTTEGSQGRVILTFPPDVSTGIIYHIIQNTTTDIMLDFNGNEAYITYFNADDSTVGTVVGSKIFSLKSSNVSDNFTSTINIISYNDGENIIWKNLTIAFVAGLQLLSDDSEATLSRNYGMIEEYKSSYLTAHFTLKDNVDYKFDENVDISFTGDSSLSISETKGGAQVTTFESDYTTKTFYITGGETGHYTITFHYASPAGGNETQTLSLDLYEDASTLTASKSTVIANGVDFADITATVKDTDDNTYAQKNISFASSSVLDDLSVESGNTDNSGVLVSRLTSDSVTTHTSTITARSNTDNYDLSSSVEINFIDQDFFQQYGPIYAYYKYDTYNFDTNIWYDTYLNNNADSEDRITEPYPTYSNIASGPWVSFEHDSSFKFKPGSFPPSSTIFFRAKYTPNTSNTGRIFQGDRSVNPTNQTNYQLGWGDADQAGTFYLGNVGGYFGGGAGGAAPSNTGFANHIVTFRTSLNGTYHVFIDGVGSARDGSLANENKFGTVNDINVQNSIIPNRIIINGADSLISDILIYETNTLSDSDVAAITARIQSNYV